MAQPAASVMHFLEFSRRYSKAERDYQNARHTELSSNRAEAALSMKQALEAEFARVFVLKSPPIWENVEAMARGDGNEGW